MGHAPLKATAARKRHYPDTALSYFNKFKAVLKQAYKDELINTDLNDRIQAIKATEIKREFLTLKELQALYNTECSLPVMKQAAISKYVKPISLHMAKAFYIHC